MMHVREHLLDPKTRQLRALRLEKEAREATSQAASPRAPREKLDGTIQDFWDRVDTSGGIDACHPWTGRVNTTWTTYGVGEFALKECVTKLAHRIILFLIYGREVWQEHDVVPICDNRLCCNERHLVVNGFKRGMYADEYFASIAAIGADKSAA